ncbi:RagB/SusD family nutrient uptake outer membrane protein [Parabacteroides sp. AM58-2XD]|uniref:RagB/SusD family nutrient uptake outer membrane protein n=1 Tax=Parabacteroides sp. AM58-2XD TaxID=2292362 RepID=UPI000FE1BBA1|nr:MULTISPECIES: RagB/SusD family nutrient uptake outer membrane protein [Parabacteroides]RGZ02150.1 RagB/SusD family nutrient uptake outer membrane protein [Parabacteroides sp. AM58-2XD]GKG73772.1 starch-binding protein [Parabacteroides goldsteinii]GKG79708.1 starch-binding protein [Parabacteroides goldsteinii]
MRYLRYLKHLIIVAFIALYCSMSSCNYLNVDDYFMDTLGYDSIFQNKLNLQQYLWGTAAFFYDEGAIWGSTYTPGVVGSDEAFTMWDHDEYPGTQFVLGNINPDNLMSMNVWPQMYKIIRKTNLIFQRIDECKDLTTLEEREILGYAHFMRAYAYYHILMNFGPVVLIGDETLETNEKPEYYNRERATYDESVDYICDELELAAKYIPLTVSMGQFGRPTRGAAYGLIARLRLQQASPLFNGGAAAKTHFAAWKRTVDGVDYVSQQYDEKKWAVAAAAAKRVIDMGVYELYTVKRDSTTMPLPKNVPSGDFPNGAGNIDPFKSYSDMFTGEALSQKNTEFVWGRISGNVRNYTRHAFPIDNLGGWNGMAIPQKIVDAYYMVDGRDINDSSEEYPYSEIGFSSEKQSFSGYQLNNGVYNMYMNREMRFYASIGFSECFWPCFSTSESGRRNQTITYFKGGNSGKDRTNSDIRNYPITGYVIKKFIHKDDAWAGNDAETLEKPFPIIRYAEILLSYVEALNNLTGGHTITDAEGNSQTFTRDVNEMAKYFNMIRYRAGLPGLTSAELLSPDQMFDLIVRERMIEFLHENRRFYDVRRWGIYEEVDKEPIVGMDTESRKDSYYERTVVNHPIARNRKVERKMIWLPISRQEIRKVPKMDQNPGWDN